MQYGQLPVYMEDGNKVVEMRRYMKISLFLWFDIIYSK